MRKALDREGMCVSLLDVMTRDGVSEATCLRLTLIPPNVQKVELPPEFQADVGSHPILGPQGPCQLHPCPSPWQKLSGLHGLAQGLIRGTRSLRQAGCLCWRHSLEIQQPVP